MLISQQLKDAIKVAKAARASVERAEGMSPSELSMTIDALAQSSISLESVVEAAYCEGVFIDESVRDVVGAQLEAACKMADVVKQSNSRAINPGSALEAAVVLARKLEIDTVEAERKLADSFFHRLTPSYTESGNAKNVLTLDNDVLDLPELTQTTLLDSLNLRFQREVIYTHVGDVVVSVNPFKPTGSVGSSLLSRYRTGERRELPPHIYGLMARAYNTMLMQARQPVEFGIDHASNEGTSHAIAPPTLETPHQPSRLVAAANQSVIITGESGAGKTEAMKICLQFITWVSSGANSPNFSPVRSRRSSSKDTTWQSPPPPTMENTCVHKLLLTNPVMEALGNAATVRNHNSSRFGKHFDIQVHSHSGEIIGAHTSVYLLEKPRIASHALEERNFHIFYMLLHAPAEFRQSCSLSSKWEDYSILSYDVSSTTFSSVDFERFEEMNDSFLTLGFSEEEREQCFRMIALVLQLGNLQFVPLGSDDEEGCSVKDAAQLKICADLLRVDPETLQAALCWRKMGGGGAVEQYTLARSAAAARMVRGSMCMHIYSLVFGWVVQEINKLISAPGEGAVCMGLLDIFGFENFGQNSFPQLCINYTNEMLHNLFIEHVIKQEQEVYIREGVEWTLVDYADNTHIVNLIAARPICIFGVLDDGCRTGNNFSVLNALHEKFASEGREVRGYIKPKHNGNECFVVSHYAGEVTYYIRNFVELNRDELSLDIQELLETRSGFEHLRALAKQEASKRENRAGDHGRGAGRRSTVSREFGRSVEALVSRLRANQPHYIRCLKPNQQLEPSVWDQVYMSKQLAYSGLLEVALVRQAGFAHRREFDAFYGYYKVCLATIKHKELVTKTGRERVAGLLEELHVDSSHYLIGHRLVFLRKQALEVLDVERGKHHSRVFFAMMLVSTCIARFARRVRKRLALALQEEAERLALDSDGEDADEAKRLRKFELRGALLRSLKAAKLKAKEKTELQDAAAPSVHEATRLFESKFQSSGPAAAARARELATEAPRRAGMGTLIGMFDAKVAKEGVSRRFDARSMPPHVDRGQESVAWNHKHQVQQDKEYEQQLEALRREFAEQFQTLREELVHVHKQVATSQSRESLNAENNNYLDNHTVRDIGTLPTCPACNDHGPRAAFKAAANTLLDDENVSDDAEFLENGHSPGQVHYDYSRDDYYDSQYLGSSDFDVLSANDQIGDRAASDDLRNVAQKIMDEELLPMDEAFPPVDDRLAPMDEVSAPRDEDLTSEFVPIWETPSESISISFHACRLRHLNELHQALNAQHVEPSEVAHLDLSSNNLLDLGDLGSDETLHDTSLSGFCGLLSLDFSRNSVFEVVGLPTALLHLNGSHNQLESAAFLSHLNALVELDLSYNMISNIADLGNLTKLQRLLLVGNRVETLKGLSSLKRLRELDLKCNYVSAMSDIKLLILNDELRSLTLQGNPVAKTPTYRKSTMIFLPNLEMLDGHPLNPSTESELSVHSPARRVPPYSPEAWPLPARRHPHESTISFNSFDRLSRAREHIVGSSQIMAATAVSAITENLTQVAVGLNHSDGIPPSVLFNEAEGPGLIERIKQEQATRARCGRGGELPIRYRRQHHSESLSRAPASASIGGSAALPKSSSKLTLTQACKEGFLSHSSPKKKADRQKELEEGLSRLLSPTISSLAAQNSPRNKAEKGTKHEPGRLQYITDHRGVMQKLN